MTCKTSWPADRDTFEIAGLTSGLTVTTKLCVATLVGVPLSATMTVNGLVVFAWLTSGRQASTPLLLLMTALVGAVGRPKVRVCTGTSLSVAELVIVSVTPAPIVRLLIAASVGGVLFPGFANCSTGW